MIAFFIKLQFATGLLHSYGKIIVKNWRDLPTNVLFILACIFSSQVYLIGIIFSRATYESWNYIFSNLLNPNVLLVFSSLAAFGMLGMWYTIATAKIIKVIV